MSRIVFPADNVGEAKSYIKALTGSANVDIPPAPLPEELGQVLDVKTKFVSASTAVELGFGYGAFSANTDVKVLVQDYWYLKEVPSVIPEVNSWTFAAGFRVGILIVGYKAELNVGIGMLAAKAQTQGLNVQAQLLRVGMPLGPDVPVDLATPTALNVDKFGSLCLWEGSVLKYVRDSRKELKPVLVSASINIPGERLLNEGTGIRFALWRIKNGKTLRQALDLLVKVPEVSEGEVRAAYQAIFDDSSMLVPGMASEQRKPGVRETGDADRWLNGYSKI